MGIYKNKYSQPFSSGKKGLLKGNYKVIAKKAKCSKMYVVFVLNGYLSGKTDKYKDVIIACEKFIKQGYKSI